MRVEAFEELFELYAEIAEALQLPVGTVRSRLHRARAHVRAALEQQEALNG